MIPSSLEILLRFLDWCRDFNSYVFFEKVAFMLILLGYGVNPLIDSTFSFCYESIVLVSSSVFQFFDIGL